MRRYKRFFADIQLDDGDIITAHCANSGSMRSCMEEGWPVLISEQNRKDRKLKFTWELSYNGHSWINTNTLRSNRIVEEAIRDGLLPSINPHASILSEFPIQSGDKRHRADFLICPHISDVEIKDLKKKFAHTNPVHLREKLKALYTSDSSMNAYNSNPRRKEARNITLDDFILLEVKNVSLLEKDGILYFPDSVSKRAKSQIELMLEYKRVGFRVMLFYLIGREDGKFFSPADHIDPGYGAMVREAKAAGVEFLAYRCRITPEKINVFKSVEIRL